MTLVALSMLQKVGTNTASSLDSVERLHALYAVLDRCEDSAAREVRR